MYVYISTKFIISNFGSKSIRLYSHLGINIVYNIYYTVYIVTAMILGKIKLKIRVRTYCGQWSIPHPISRQSTHYNTPQVELEEELRQSRFNFRSRTEDIMASHWLGGGGNRFICTLTGVSLDRFTMISQGNRSSKTYPSHYIHYSVNSYMILY